MAFRLFVGMAEGVACIIGKSLLLLVFHPSRLLSRFVIVKESTTPVQDGEPFFAGPLQDLLLILQGFLTLQVSGHDCLLVEGDRWDPYAILIWLLLWNVKD